MRQYYFFPTLNGIKIPYYQYVDEKVIFTGILMGSILYGTRKTPPPPLPHLSTRAHSVRSVVLGIVVALFFKCMAALLKPIHLRGDGVKWGLISCTVVMFSFVTVFTATSLIVQSNSYIDNRGFRDFYENRLLGPYIYEPHEYQSATNCPTTPVFIPGLMFLFNYWLTDGLLVHPSFFAAFVRSGI